jgi:hypothetical protein
MVAPAGRSAGVMGCILGQASIIPDDTCDLGGSVTIYVLNH